MNKCSHCGQPADQTALRVSVFGMYDMHLFHRFEADSPHALLAAWREHNSSPNPAIVGDRKVDDLGAADLCPAIVLGPNDIEIRRVGKMVFWGSKTREQGAAEYLAELMSDPDIPRLLFEQYGARND